MIALGSAITVPKAIEREIKIAWLEVQVQQIKTILEDHGCDCDCDHSAEEHGTECARCLGCRIQTVLSEAAK